MVKPTGGLAPKIHMVAGTLGCPFKLIITRDQCEDAPIAITRLTGRTSKSVPRLYSAL